MRSIFRVRSGAIRLLVGLSVLVGCGSIKENKPPNEAMCCTTDADCNAVGLPPGSGCSQGETCTGNLCVAAVCETAAQCTADQPVCDLTANTCTGCKVSADCAAYDQASVCDPSTGGCRGCRVDDECASDACDVDTGACLAAANVIYAKPSGSSTAACTQSDPCSITHAVELATADITTSTIRMLPGTYGAGIFIGSSTVNIIGTGATVLGSATGDDTPFKATGSANISVRGLTFDLSRGLLVCDGRGTGQPAVSLRDLEILGDRAVFASSCVMKWQRVELSSCVGVGACDAFLTIGEGGTTAPTVVDIADSRIRSKSTTDLGMFVLGTRQTLRIVNSVLDTTRITFSNSDDATTKSHLELAFITQLCRSGACVTGCSTTANTNKTTLIENSIFQTMSTADVIDGPRCTTAHNILSLQAAAIPGSNIVADPKLVDPINRDFQLALGSPAIDAAMPSTGNNPDHDVAGTKRPQGASPDIGAFERTP